jgi:hypothetical protein
MTIPTESQQSRIGPVYLALFALAVLCPETAFAHVSEQALVLLLPTDMFVAGGSLAVAVSVLVVSLVPRGTIGKLFKSSALAGREVSQGFRTAVSLLSFAALCVLLFAGLNGPRDPMANLLPLTIWTGGWILFFSLCGLIGNFWSILNPWTGLFRLVMGSMDRDGLLPLPKRLGYLPALMSTFAFFAFMIADPAPNDPDRLAIIVGVYWAFNFLGMVVFGGSTWLSRCEGISVMLALIAQNALFRWTGDLRTGLFGWRIAEDRRMPVTLAMVALMVLAGGSFDGLKETFWWLGILGVNPLEFPGRSAVVVPSILGLAAFGIGLIAVFFVVCWAGIKMVDLLSGGTPRPTALQAFVAFAPATLPIALGYHMSHFLVSFMIDGQYLIAVLSDPLATGANLFGMADRPVTTGFLSYSVSAQRIWMTQAGIVVAGHVLAVVVSHHLAERLFATRRQLIVGQIPISAFMIAYTWFGLWLLAAPRGM